MERWDVARQLSFIRTARRCYALVLLAAALGLAVSVASYYGQAEPIATASAGEPR